MVVARITFVVESLRFGVGKLRVFLIWNIGLFRQPGINAFACYYHRVPKYQILQDLVNWVKIRLLL